MPRRRKTPPDGRVNSGGSRQGTPGGQYGNRSDLRAAPVTTAKGQGYGKAAAQQAAQQAVPMAGQPQNMAQGGPGPMNIPIPPDATPTFGTPSNRPDEPLESGLPFGPGRTPQPGQRPNDFVNDEVVDRLRALYLQFPTRELAELIDQTWER